MYFLKLRYTICLGGRDIVENISQRHQKGRKWAIFSGVLCHSAQKLTCSQLSLPHKQTGPVRTTRRSDTRAARRRPRNK